MKAFDENNNLVGYLQNDNGKLIMLGVAEAKENPEASKLTYGFHKRVFFAKEFADWFFASSVITIVGIVLVNVFMNGFTYFMENFTLLVPHSVLLMAPLAFVMRLVATFYGTRMDLRISWAFVIYIAQLITIYVTEMTNSEAVGTLIVGFLDVFLLYWLRRVLKDYLSMFPKQVKNDNDFEVSFSWIFILFLLIPLLVCLIMIIKGEYGNNDLNVILILLMILYRLAEMTQFYRVGNLIRKANL